MKKRYSRLERTAYHEAGHAVAAYLLNMPFEFVSIQKRRGSLGRLKKKMSKKMIDKLSLDRLRLLVEKLSIINYAGFISELLLSDELNIKTLVGRSFSDFKQVDNNIVPLICEDEDEAYFYIQWLTSHTLNILYKPRSRAYIETLAVALLEQKTIKYRKVRIILKEAEKEFVKT